MFKPQTQIDRKKVYQILSVYLLALVAAVICGNGMSGKSMASPKAEIIVSK